MMKLIEQPRIVLVGCGGIASGGWAGSMSQFEQAQIVGVVDLELERANAFCERHGYKDIVIGTDLASVIEKAAANVVFDCTTPSAHSSVTLTALENGCHVLGEKPLSDNLEDARQMVKSASESELIYAVMQNRRYDEGIHSLRRFLDSGMLGELTTLNADFYLAPRFGGFRDEMKHVLLIDMAIHSFDQARFLSGSDAVSVYCHEWNPKGSWYNHGASAVAVFEMANGSVFTYRGSWCADGLPTSWECQWRAQCVNGAAKWDGQKEIVAQRMVVSDKIGRSRVDVNVPVDSKLQHKGHAGCIGEFLKALENGDTPETVCHDNIKTLAMVLAAVESAESGQRVAVAN
jgi:predicted dehydrogenase